MHEKYVESKVIWLCDEAETGELAPRAAACGSRWEMPRAGIPGCPEEVWGEDRGPAPGIQRAGASVDVQTVCNTGLERAEICVGRGLRAGPRRATRHSKERTG